LRCPTHPARPPSHVGDPHRAHRSDFCEVLAGYTLTKTTRGRPCPLRARRVCWACVGESWHLVQRIPASVAHFSRSLKFCALPFRTVWRTIIPWSNPGLSTSHTCVPSGRGSTARSLPSTHGPEGSTPRDLTPHVSDHCIPAAPHGPPGPALDPPNPRHEGYEREVQAGRGRGDCTASGDYTRSWGRHIAVYAFSLRLLPRAGLYGCEVRRRDQCWFPQLCEPAISIRFGSQP